MPRGAAADARLMEGVPASFAFPASRTFPACSNLLIETPAEGRGAALAVLQASMFRLLTSLPPGQVRFTIIDPIGIGRNFGAFMHLADFDGALVTQQVWTDARQIEERLADLATHMEDRDAEIPAGITSMLTIEEYNATGGPGSRRAVPGAGHRRLPDPLRREVRRLRLGRHRGRRRSMRRLDAGRGRHVQAVAVSISAR